MKITDLILEETGWLSSGVSDLIQGDLDLVDRDHTDRRFPTYSISVPDRVCALLRVFSLALWFLP